MFEVRVTKEHDYRDSTHGPFETRAAAERFAIGLAESGSLRRVASAGLHEPYLARVSIVEIDEDEE